MNETVSSVVRLAARRHHVVTREELFQELQLTSTQVNRLLSQGLLTPVRRGIFLVGSDVPSFAQLQRVACAVHPEVMLSGPGTAGFWGLRRAAREDLEVTVPTGLELTIPRARIRRSNCIAPTDAVLSPDGLRVTTPARLLFDLADRVDRFTLRSVHEDALNRELVTAEQIADIADRLCGRGRPGSQMFRDVVLARSPEAPPVQSEDELVLVEALVAAGLPEPARQHPVRLPNGRIVYLDVFIGESLVDVEVDHSTWHAGLVDVHRDKSRDAALRQLGIEPYRVTDHHVRHELAATVGLIADYHEHRLALLGRFPRT